MTDALRTRAVGALVVGAALALLAGFGGVVAIVCGLLAQPVFALGASWWRRTRAAAPLPALFKRDVPSLLALWVGGVLLLALLVAWPLAALRGSGSLAAVLALGVAVSLAVLALWRTWLLWQAVERDGGTLRTHAPTLSVPSMESWHGLSAALALLALCAAVIAPAWPGLLGAGWHWPLAVATALLSPLLHGVLQAAPSAPPAAGGRTAGLRPVRRAAARASAAGAAGAAPTGAAVVRRRAQRPHRPCAAIARRRRRPARAAAGRRARPRAASPCWPPCCPTCAYCGP